MTMTMTTDGTVAIERIAVIGGGGRRFEVVEAAGPQISDREDDAPGGQKDLADSSEHYRSIFTLPAPARSLVG